MTKQHLTETPQRIRGTRDENVERVLSRELGKRYRDYRKKWVTVSKRETVTDFPLYIQIEHCGKCNLRCPTCIQGIGPLRKEYSKGFKPLDMLLYKKILDEAGKYRCPSMSFHNNDEPLLLGDLDKRIHLAREAGFLDIILTTNATLLTRERALKLLTSGITKINFSVDAYRSKDYKRVRGGDFDTVLRNIEYFCETRKRAGPTLPITIDTASIIS